MSKALDRIFEPGKGYIIFRIGAFLFYRMLMALAATRYFPELLQNGRVQAMIYIIQTTR